MPYIKNKKDKIMMTSKTEILLEIERHTRNTSSNTSWIKWILLIPIILAGIIYALSILGVVYLFNY